MAKKQTAVAVVGQPAETAASHEVGTFIMQAIQQGTPVEVMERLFALREKVKAEAAKEAFVGAMSAFQAECPVITKDRAVMNKDGRSVRYKYAPLDSIVDQVRAFLGKNGLSYTVDLQNKDGVMIATCKITHILGHSETSTFEAPIDKDSYMSAPQQYAAASTFAKRYAFCNALGILTGDEDNDAVGVGSKTQEKKSVFDVALGMIERTTDGAVLKEYWGKISASDKYTTEEKEKLEGAIASRLQDLSGEEKQ